MSNMLYVIYHMYRIMCNVHAICVWICDMHVHICDQNAHPTPSPTVESVDDKTLRTLQPTFTLREVCLHPELEETCGVTLQTLKDSPGLLKSHIRNLAFYLRFHITKNMVSGPFWVRGHSDTSQITVLTYLKSISLISMNTQKHIYRHRR